MQRLFVHAVIFFAMITAIETSSATIADHFLFRDEALRRLEQVDSADTLTRIKLLINLAFLKDYEGYKDYRKEAQQLIKAFRAGDSTALVDAYWNVSKIMEVRDWGWWSKFTKHPIDTIVQALDSLSYAREQDSLNGIIPFLRISAAIEAADNIPKLLSIARDDLRYLDFGLDRSDEGAKFFLELLWAKYYYWRVEKGEEHTKQRFLTFSQFHINEAIRYAECQYYQDEIVEWYKRINKKKPDTKIWSKKVLKLVRDND